MPRGDGKRIKDRGQVSERSSHMKPNSTGGCCVFPGWRWIPGLEGTGPVETPLDPAGPLSGAQSMYTR